MTREQTDLMVAEHIELMALPAAVDLLDTLVRFGDLSEEDDMEEKLRIIVGALKQAAGRLTVRAAAERVT